MTFHLIYHLNKKFSKEFMVSITSFKTSSIQHDDHFANYGPIDNKVEYVFGHGFLVIGRLLQCFLEFSVRSNQNGGVAKHILSSYTVLSKFGHLIK